MHAAIVHLTPLLAAEKNKVPYYIAGGVLVAWALILSVGIGMRNPNFPGTLAGQRMVMAISAVLVVVTVSMAVVTSGGSTSKATTTTATTTSSVSPTTTSTTAAPAPPSGAATTPSPSSGQASSGSTLEDAANSEGQLRFTSSKLSAKAGSVTISFTNASPLMHNMTIAQGTKVLGATPTFQGGARTLTLNLKPGTYTFYCSVPGHRQAGMEGTLTVS